MSNIDKRALREVAERATPGNWRRTSSLFNGITVTPFSLCGEEVTLAHTVEKRDAEFIAAANPATMLALLDELETKEEQRANWFQMAQKLGEDLDAAERHIAETNRLNAELTAKIEPMDRRIAELERSETQLINERDSAESALNDAYKAVMGQAPEWINWFSFENAIEEMELACELWRNQTYDVIQFRQRIAELEAKLANPVLLPKTNGYWNEQEKAYEEAITLAKRQVRLAGFSVEDM